MTGDEHDEYICAPVLPNGRGWSLLIWGGILVLLGLLLVALSRATGLGQLLGDRVFHVGNATIHFPIVTMLLLSIVLTIILNLVIRLFRG